MKMEDEQLSKRLNDIEEKILLLSAAIRELGAIVDYRMENVRVNFVSDYTVYNATDTKHLRSLLYRIDKIGTE